VVRNRKHRLQVIFDGTLELVCRITTSTACFFNKIVMKLKSPSAPGPQALDWRHQSLTGMQSPSTRTDTNVFRAYGHVRPALDQYGVSYNFVLEFFQLRTTLLCPLRVQALQILLFLEFYLFSIQLRTQPVKFCEEFLKHSN
jgi:hypothetical protein